MEETGVPRENHRPVASHWQTLSHNVVSSAPRLSGIRIHKVVIGSNCIGSNKSNYHTITTTTAPQFNRNKDEIKHANKGIININNYFQVIILIITLQGELWKKMNSEQIKVDSHKDKINLIYSYIGCGCIMSISLSHG